MNNILKKTLAVTLSVVTVISTGMVAEATELTPVEKTENENGEVVVQSTDKSTEYTSIPKQIEGALPEVSAEPILNVNSVEEIDSKDTINETSDSVFKSCRLIITNPTDLEFKEESLGVDNIVSVQKYEDKYFVTYRSVFATEKAYNDLTALGLNVEIDVVQDTPEGVEIKDDNGNDIESKNIALTEETRPTKSVEDVVVEDTQKNEKTIVVAVLDTGLNNDEAIFEDKVIEGKNFVSEQSDVKDLDTHGTTMSRIILESVNEENTNNAIKVMPIKVLNDEGKGTTLSAYKGIKYVIEKKKENPSLDFVINLSMSGIGHSKLLESAINEAYNNNIPVVVSAGNDNKEITEYTPANIDSAFTITSAVKNEDKITKAVYSNYGSEADYTTSGHYEYVREIQNEKVVTKVDGTSVSSAYVSSYIVILKQMALSDDNEDNDVLNIADIDTSLSESAIATNDLTLGKGFLAKENIISKKIEEAKRPEETLPVTSNTSNEALPVEDVNFINENIELCKQDWYTDGIMKWDSYRLAATNEKGLQTLLSAYYDKDGQYSAMWAWWYTYQGVGWDWKTIILPYDISVTSQKVPTASQAKILQGWKNGGKTNAIITNKIPTPYCEYQASLAVGGKTNITFNNINMNGNNHKIIYEKVSSHSNNTANIFICPGATFNANDCNFYNTQAKIDGLPGIASIFNNRGTVNLTRCKVYNNESGIYVGGKTTETDCDIYNNEVIGIHVDGASSSSSSKCRITNNGSVGIFSVGDVSLDNNTIITAGKGKECLQNIFDGTVVSKGTTFKDGRVLNFGTFTSEDDEISNTYTTGISNLASFADMYGKGVLTIKGKTKIHDCNGIGLENVAGGTCTIKGGSIEKNQTGIQNDATLNIKGGSVSSNTTRGVQNNGTFNLESGSINNNGTTNPTNWGWGIENYGTVNQSGGNIYSNGNKKPDGDSVNSGIYQDGTYNVGAKAEIRPSNSVYLTSGKVINVISNLSTANPIPLTTDTNDRTVGRVLVTSNSTALADANESKFKLAFAQPVKDSDGAGFSGKSSSGVVRTGSRMPYVDDNKMVLSGMYKVNYNGKTDDTQSIFSYNPSDNFFYWLEPVNEIGLADTSKVVKVTSWEPYEETDLSAEGTGEYEFMGWCEKADGSDTIYKEIRTEWLTKNKPYYAIYRRGKAKVTYNPNGAVDDNGNKYNTVTDENSTSIYSDYDLQSGSTFGTLQEEEKYIAVDKKGTNDIVDNAYYKVNKGDITNNLGKKTKMYSFQGWSVVDYADHTAEEILYGGTLPFIDIVSDFNAVLDKDYQTKPNNKTLKSIVNEIKERSKYYNSGNLVKWNEEFDNNGIVNMYATWDEYPEINAKELVFTERQFNNITEEDLLKKLTATDREDGDITKKVKILNFDDVVKTLNSLNTTAATTVTYEVTDSAGNTTRAYAEVWRNSDTPLQVSDPEHTAHIRSICRQAYDTHDPKNGGCMKDSLWYNNPEYVQVMLTGFDNMENDVSIMSYTHTKEDRERASEYIDEHGIGNAFESDGLKKYGELFATSEYETQNRMDILIDGNDEDSSITILGFEFKWNDKELNKLRKKKDQARIERLRNKIAQASNPQA